MPKKAYLWNYATGSDITVDTLPTVVVRIVTFFHEILVTCVICPFINHEAATLHSDRIAVAEIGTQICAVTAALKTTALEIPVFVKNYLEYKAMFMLPIKIT